MAVKYHQISLKDIFSDCRDMFIDDTPSFFQLLEEHFDLSEFIPSVFYNAFYQHLGRKRDYPLTAFLSALILQKIFSIPTDSLLILLLHICKELRDFCGFSKVPDAPLFTRFKLGFADHIELMFQQMVDYTEPICQTVDASLASMLTFDTSGIELYVTENNPKTLNSLIRRLKTYYKDNPDVDPYKMAYGLMPSQAASCPDAKQQYINGHFCYADKFAILTNGLGIVRHITFLDDDFNGHVERVIRSYSVGRANWLFADTVRGAKVNAIMYSIVETAKANNANVPIYLQYLFEQIPLHRAGGDKDYMADMIPWSEKYRVYEEKKQQQRRSVYGQLFPEPERPRTPRKRDPGTETDLTA